MFVLQSLRALIPGLKHMITVFEDIVEKNTKQFVFKVQQLSDGTYSVTQQALRVFPDGGTAVKSEQKWHYKNLKELREGEYKKSRQGKMFLENQFWVGKTV